MLSSQKNLIETMIFSIDSSMFHCGRIEKCNKEVQPYQVVIVYTFLTPSRGLYNGLSWSVLFRLSFNCCVIDFIRLDNT